jgi:hypothetical protein
LNLAKYVALYGRAEEAGATRSGYVRQASARDYAMQSVIAQRAPNDQSKCVFLRIYAPFRATIDISGVLGGQSGPAVSYVS